LATCIALSTQTKDVWLRAAQNNMNPEERIERRLQWMTRTLSLSSEQREKIKGILEGEHNRYEALSAQRKALREETDRSISQVLSPEQRVTFEAANKRQDKRRARGRASTNS